jgi:hypothetical protein
VANEQGWKEIRDAKNRLNRAMRKTILAKPFNKNDPKYKEKKQ